MNGADLSLQNFLIDTGVLSRSQVDAALRQAEDKSFAEAIIAGGFLSEDELRRASAHALGVPFVTLGKGDIAVASLLFIPEPLSRTANIVAYRHDAEGIEVALLDIADLPQIDFLRTAYRVKVRMTDKSSIKLALLQYQKHLKEKFAGMLEESKEAAESLLKHALHSGAHYIHIEPATAEAAGMVVKYRIEGALREAMRLPAETSRYIVERLKSLAKLFPVTTTVQDGSFTFMHDNEEVGVALTAAPTVRGEKLTMRLSRQQQTTAGFSLASLGLHGDGLELVQKALHKQKGAIVVAGMSASGKTTMLYTLLDHLSGAHLSVSSVENSVEYRLPRVHQTATRPDLGLTIPSALRAVLKQDPDAVMVSDLAEGDAAQIALASAQRSVFILGGISARTAASALDMLTSELSVSSSIVEKNVKVVIAQRVLRKLQEGADARALTRLEAQALEGKVRFAKVLAALKQEGVVHEHTAWKDILFYTATDAESYRGYVGIQEVLEVGSPEDEMLTMLEDALFKSVQGLTSIEEVVEMASE